MKKSILLFCTCFVFIFSHAQKTEAVPKPGIELLTFPGQLSVTHNSVTINGKKIDYTATTGYTDLRNDTEKTIAKIFVTYYRKDAEAPGKRRLTFAFNGRPGSSSVWLHMGVLGP